MQRCSTLLPCPCTSHGACMRAPPPHAACACSVCALTVCTYLVLLPPACTITLVLRMNAPSNEHALHLHACTRVEILLAHAHAVCLHDARLHAFCSQGGSIVVDGVVASAHSNFVLDDITPSSLTHMLPYVYQALMVTPLTILYRVLGPQNMHTVRA